MTYELPTAPSSIGGVLDSAFRLYRDCMRKSWPLALLYALVLGLFGVYWALSLGDVARPGAKDPRLVLATLFSPAAICGFVVAMAVSLVFYGALVKQISAWAQGNESLSLGGAIAVGARRFPGMLVGFVLSALTILVGFMLLVIPGIYFMGKLPLWITALFMDDAGAIESLGISWRLTRGRWWRGTIILTVALIILYVFSLALGLVAGLITALAHLSLTDTSIVQQVFAVAANMVVLPLFISMFVVMYHDFKLRSEGGDLAARMETLGKA